MASEFKRNLALSRLYRPLHPQPREAGADFCRWIFELKMDGYRLMVRRIDDKVRIYSRRGADFTPRFQRIVEAVRTLKVKSVLLDGEGIVYGHTGLPDFAPIHSKEYDREVSLVAFDLLELDGSDLRSPYSIARRAWLS